MIAGQVPFPSPSLPEKLFAHQALEAVPLGEIVPNVPPELVEIVRRMMRKQPEERYPTPLLVAQVLEPFVEEQARLSEVMPEPPVLILDESSQNENGEPRQQLANKPEKTSPAIPDSPSQSGVKPATEPVQPVAVPVLDPSTVSPILTPIPDEGQNRALPPSTASPSRSGSASSAKRHPAVSRSRPGTVSQ